MFKCKSTEWILFGIFMNSGNNSNERKKITIQYNYIETRFFYQQFQCSSNLWPLGRNIVHVYSNNYNRNSNTVFEYSMINYNSFFWRPRNKEETMKKKGLLKIAIKKERKDRRPFAVYNPKTFYSIWRNAIRPNQSSTYVRSLSIPTHQED